MVAGQDTSIGAGGSAFGQTRWGRIAAAAAASDPAALAELAAAYWRPVYRFVRTAWRKDNEEAKDLTQEFFATVFQPRLLARADPERGSFRNFLLATLKNFLRDRARHDGGLKRGGGAAQVSIEGAEVASSDADPEREFTRGWAEGLLAEALAELERGLVSRGRERVFRVFRESCQDENLSYRALAERCGVSVTDVTNYLFEARRELRRLLEARVAAYVGSRPEIERELRELFEA